MPCGYSSPPRTSTELAEFLLNKQSLYQYRCMLIVCQIHKCVLQLVPVCLSSRFVFNGNFGYFTRGGDKIYLIWPKTEFTRSSLQFKGAQSYNNFSSSVCHLRNLSAFKCGCVIYFCNQCRYNYDFSLIFILGILCTAFNHCTHAGLPQRCC